jgi:hypothetical protein
MAGLVPAIHVFGSTRKASVYARDERGHDDPSLRGLASGAVGEAHRASLTPFLAL